MDALAAVWDDSEHNRESVSKGKLPMPVLQIGGAKAVGAFGLPSVQQLASNVRGEVIENAGHWLTEEQPVAFATVLLKFFT